MNPDLDPYVDHLAVEQACDGYPVGLTAREREQVVRVLTGRGYTTLRIADRLNLTPRTVTRIRKRVAA